jgi:hypothetical protein
MKTTLAVLLFAVSSISFGAELSLHSHNTITLKKTDKNVFEKINEVALVNTSITSTVINNTSSNKYVNDDKMIITAGKSTVHILDESAGIDKDVVASVERSLLGKVKSITIKSENLENAYFESFKKQGILDLANLDLQKDKRKSLSVSDQVCVVESELATCTYDMDLKVQNNGFTITAAILALQLGAQQTN